MENNEIILPEENKTCPAVGYQKVDICVPVTIKAFAKAGPTITKCCGDAIVVSGIEPCTGIKNGECHFTISQILCVEIPIEFGAESSTGDTYVNCLGVSSDNICLDCDKEETT